MNSFTKTQAITEIVRCTPGLPVVFTTGYASRIGAGVADRPQHFYMTGSMGLALSVGTGVAATVGTPTVVVDGDGSVLMNPVGLISVGTRRELPLAHIVLDDGQYASTGGQGTPKAAFDFAALARTTGYRSVHTVTGVGQLTSLLDEFLDQPAGPRFVHCVLRGIDSPPPARISQPLPEHARRFTEGVVGHRSTVPR
ncbi:thiamine pyrophosphate-dependent enzyme [Streptomyces roseochromogenus]|uniref:Thiamine pyrophosphate enzyme TPP-binding domain-containing protein n=1 Tax=Streptomyces roseochromogenus subsp. oscitans DS 12.976 TaxID=1352936 RepID=V6KP14_STRRC|nr:thiamine pyrophosphate-dependent enzyme [Streptomyces roseochromogenus]EST33753.1 hypothetical protein M878_11955 [Streptomyces roseochromogenus subsp. oscitans DS 12.976]